MQAERERLEKEEEKEQRRRAAEERARRIEEEKKNRGKKKKAEKKDADEDKIPGSVKEMSRVGMRQYARGRAYDPYRYSEDGPTPYPGEEPIFPPRTGNEAPELTEHAGEEPAVEREPVSLEKPAQSQPSEEETKE